MKIIFLGTGAGMPSIQRNLPSIYINHSNEHWLWDCGEGTQTQLLKAGVSWMKINRIFITHFHADHFVGLIGLIQSMNLERRKEPLEIYGPEAERFVDDIIDLGYWGVGFPVIAKNVDFERITEIVRGEGFSITAIPVKHSVPSVGYYFKEDDKVNIDIVKAKKFGVKPGPDVEWIKKSKQFMHEGKDVFWKFAKPVKGRSVAYTGDTMIHEPFFEIVKGCNILVHDSTFAEESEHAHSTVVDAAKMSKKYKVEKLIATHISRRYKDPREIERLAKKYFRNSVVAYDLMRIEL